MQKKEAWDADGSVLCFSFGFADFGGRAPLGSFLHLYRELGIKRWVRTFSSFAIRRVNRTAILD